jgi:ABC-type nitrate/sulfonate/bicarbonate transport system substrate-binding protein
VSFTFPRSSASRFALAVTASALAISVVALPAHAANAKKKKPKGRPTVSAAPTVAPTTPRTTPTTSAPATTAAPVTTARPAAVASGNGVTTAGISEARCAANKAAGKITYLSGFDYAATASIIEMIVADDKGYFKKMCLDVDVKASFSTANYAVVADNKAQFASAGSYTELLRNTPKERQLTAVYELGKTPIETLMVRDDGKITRITDLRGKLIGMKGDIPPSIVAMLNKAGLKRGVDYRDQLVEGFNPVAHFSLPIDALPGYKSNEPGQLARNNPPVKITTFDPTEYNIPGSFGIVYTNGAFLKAHPTAAKDFVRAALLGYADAAANPDAAIATAVKRINDNGNKNFLSPVGEGFRWKVELKVVADSTPAGQPIGVINPRTLQEQVDAYTEAGVFATKPSIVGSYDDTLAKGVYDSKGNIVWPKA